MAYLNPTLQFWGYKIYEAKIVSDSTKEENRTIIFARAEVDMNINKKYVGSGKQDFIRILKQVDE